MREDLRRGGIVNNEFVRMLLVTDWPNHMPLNWAEIFMIIGDVSAPVTLSLKRIPNIRTLINYSANDSKWDINRSSETLVDRKEREYQSEQAEDAALMISRMNTRILETYLYIKVMGQDKEELEKNTHLVLNRLGSYGLVAQPVVANQQQSFWAASPFLLKNSVVEDRWNYAAPASTIARGLWNRDIGVCDETGIPLGHDDMGGPVRLNMLKNTFSRPNGNIEIVGEAGSGKSALMKDLIFYFRTLYDCKIIINDVEGEFVRLTNKLGGEVSSMSSSSAMLISPFEPRNFGASASTEEEDFDYFNEDEEVKQAKSQALNARVLATHLPFLTQFLMKAFSLSPVYKEIVYNACYIAYVKYGIKKETTFAQYSSKNLKYPCLKDVYESLDYVKKIINGDYDNEIDAVKNALHKAINGPEEHLWKNTESKLKDSTLMCVDMQGLSSDPNMQEAQYYNLLTWEWTQITTNRFSEQKTIIITDELQKSFTETNIGFCEKYSDMVRRARKYGASMISGFQDPAAFSKDVIAGYGRSINSCSAYKFFGTIADEDNAKTAKTLLSASNDVIEGLAKARKGRFLLKVGTERQCWINVDLDPWMFELFGKGGGE